MSSLIDSDYRYVQGSVQHTARAWMEFQASLPQAPNPVLSVNFVPAFKGCFVVLQKKREPGLLRSLIFGEPRGARQIQLILDQFCRVVGSQA